ncbi:hypothetical protein GDO86_010371 [Hymenochirus boettgeri]|uniref:Chemokine interleukin-8-like domain-containing protein n=1 Tax=Hymenochirus boettgeri TaxID=247094 RepID=A0A8T2JK78_9PIPI|nr:hypothetical protein GDO86_010371 [Hymenochirus boettgeri]
MAPSLSVLLSCLIIIIQFSQAFGIYDCCISYTKSKLPWKAIRGFSIQNSNEVCDIDAVIFQVSRRSAINKKLILVQVCTDPNQQWVQSWIEKLQ